MFEVMQLGNCTKKMQTTHAERTKNKEVTDKKKEGRGFLLLSYIKGHHRTAYLLLSYIKGHHRMY